MVVIAHHNLGAVQREQLDDAVEVLREHASVEVAMTEDPSELDGVLHRAGSRRLVIAGGDGSIHTVVAALHKRRELGDQELGLIPLGTGNDFASRMEIPLDPAEAARALLAGEPQPIDLIVDEVREVVVNSVHLGASASASRRASRWKERLGQFGVGVAGKRVSLGKLGYPIGAALTAWNPPTLRLRVEVDGEVVSDLDEPVLMVAIGNGSRVGGGMHLTPDADPTDGRLDVMISTATGPLSRFAYAASLSLASHYSRDDVVADQAREVTVSGEGFYCAADGEIYGPERRRSWHIEPAAYRLVL